MSHKVMRRDVDRGDAGKSVVRRLGREPVGGSVGGLLGGLTVWLACSFQLEHLASPWFFYFTAVTFVFGWGALALVPFEGKMVGPERIALSLAFGTVLTPLVIWLFERYRCGFLFPPLAFAATGIALGRWWAGPTSTRRPGPADWVQLLLPVGVFAVTAWVSAGRLAIDRQHLSIFGDYDTFDLTYYAVITAELTHTVPPASPFYAGHDVVYSYFPLLLLAAIHKFSGVSITQICLGLAWPFFSAICSATVFAFCRRLGSTTFAALSTVMVFAGSGLAYVPGVLWPETARFDPLIWSSMFMAPSAEWLFFNTWTPALTVVFAALYAMSRANDPAADRREWAWTVMAGVCVGLLFMFKSFAFGVLVPALVITGLLCALKRDRAAALRYGGAVGVALGCAAPWLWAITVLNRTEGRAGISIDWWSLPRRMLFKMDLTEWLASFVARMVPHDPHASVFLALATVLFLIGGLGTRSLGVMRLWKAAIGEVPAPEWTALAWVAILGVAIPFAIAVAPFPNSIQAYQFALFVLWPFAVAAVWPPVAASSLRRAILVAAFVLASIGATAHYALAAHAASTGQALASLSDDDLRIVRSLGRTDPDTTMVLHSVPLDPSLFSIESARRVVLAWSSYAAGDGSADVDARTAEIERFFGTTTGMGADDVGILYKYQVSHVIERVAIDHIHPAVVRQLRLVTGTPAVRLYEVPTTLLQ